MSDQAVWQVFVPTFYVVQKDKEQSIITDEVVDIFWYGSKDLKSKGKTNDRYLKKGLHLLSANLTSKRS